MKLNHNIRFITAASLFDGHDAAIHIMRRILQSEGAEVIHLGHNRSVRSIVKAAIEEDVQGIAVSSYQGGHVEYFTYMLELLKEYNASHIKIFGGGGGVIVDKEIKLLESRGVEKIFSPKDGVDLGLIGMIELMLKRCDHYTHPPIEAISYKESKRLFMARTISTIELGASAEKNPHYGACYKNIIHKIDELKQKHNKALVVGITGTGGAGKSSLIDELLLRFLYTFKEKKIAILSVDPTKSKSNGGLLGDRIRINCADDDRVYVRSLATREKNSSISKACKDSLDYLSLCDFDLVFLETAGIGQNDQSVSALADISLYVMTPEFGAPSQLEKIDMLDVADLVAINKFDKPGNKDALFHVRKTYQNNHRLFEKNLEAMPIYPTCAHVFGDKGVNGLFNKLMSIIEQMDQRAWGFEKLSEGDANITPIISRKRVKYLSEISDCVRDYHKHIDHQSQILKSVDALEKTHELLKKPVKEIAQTKDELMKKVDQELLSKAKKFFKQQEDYSKPHTSYQVRNKTITTNNYYSSLSHLNIPKVKTPEFSDLSSVVKFIGKENLPGFFPYTAGVFPFKRQEEDPTRMFAGEGSPERTNKRFHYLSLNHEATRLSTAFDSVTLYGEDPDLRPDIHGKIGNAGVSVCSLDDMKRLYSGFDLSSPNTSVSMTINGPAPTILAFFFNAAIDFAVEKELKAKGMWSETQKDIDAWFKANNIIRPVYRAEKLPEGHDGCGLGFLGVPASEIVSEEFYHPIKEQVLKNIRGTIQADILKEEQAQNTCIFSTEFSLRMMGDCQQYFIDNHINNFYSVSVSGYHIAEAGANPISQLAFTLANGFTLLEYYKNRGMDVDQFAKNFSFFFSNGLDPEYAVIGRVARRIWSIALKNIYGANERSQKLKYHIQTSGRSLHAQEMDFNDIRTTLQALYALADNCNSLHTNAFDEAITTPTESSVRRAVAIQMIINKELGLTKNENPLQGSYFIDYLTDKVEKAVLEVFDNLDARGGVLGAMESMYQRSCIQEESIYYEKKKISGELPIIGVNSFLSDKQSDDNIEIELMRSTKEEKNMQVDQIKALRSYCPDKKERALKHLEFSCLNMNNTFYALMEASKYASLGDISKTFFKVGGSYRRSM